LREDILMAVIPRRLLVSLAFAIAGCSGPGALETAGGIEEPRFFIADTLGPSCAIDERGGGPSRAAAAGAISRLEANSARYVADLRRSTSLTSNHDAFTANWKPVLFNSYAAAASGDEVLARTVVDGLTRLARNGRYRSEPGLITRAQALREPGCYAAGPDAPCPSHTPRFVSRMYATLLISAAVLEPYLTEADRAVLLPWFGEGYERFVVPELEADQDGLYDFANMGLARLAYAALTDDTRLARREFSARRADILRHLEPSGYIDQNSFRGVRGFWYHTYGLDPILSYALVAREWGVDLFRDPEVGPRLAAAVDKTALGIRDLAAFRAPGNRGSAYSTDPADGRPFVHQFALNLYPIAAREFGVRLPRSPMHDRLARLESYSQISGLSERCYYSGR
jgi:hypothetical protein